ncbi:DMT family transporter [Longimicrobium terrae]|uniref:Drug/metabolite transporter (DMT)-like permease n=1 Tax=Longimicrobium terrae TaxID=1639882 RepID=A0A841GXV3_9BACT|nr:DMT family transporter [Longimicrobium terrae]MBB4636196.1 drug/metabolite transporter (DMT)-like permease [Longimicrobium terrae]MBB6070591.1 drug/metabolite transporter (DMT)-like permease [Longimicrobium terrae]NNC29575.1 DMT family transporter [Longimicrobium terrae]
MDERDGATELGAEATGPVPGWGWTESSLALMVCVWGVNFAVVKDALRVFDPLGFNALRFAIASVLVYGVLRARGEAGLPARADAPRVIALGLLGNVIYQMCFILGLDRSAAGHSALILALTPVMTAFLSLATGHEQPGGRTWGGAALSITGIALVSGAGLGAQGRAGLVGDGILLAAAIAWAAYTVGARPIVARYGSVRTTAWTLWVGAAGLIPAGIPALRAQRWAAVTPGAWGGLAFSAGFAISLGYLIWYRGVERIGNTRTAIFSNLTPIVALAAGAVILRERPSTLALAGAALTLVGVMVVRTDPGSRRRAAG